jgi:hypothetical protein
MLIEWDQLHLRIRGERVQQIVVAMAQAQHWPVSDIGFEFLDGELRVSAKVHKGISVQARFSVDTIKVLHKTLEVPIKNLTAFGGLLPVPKFLFRLIGTAGLPDGITFDIETLTMFVDLEKLLPRSVDLNVEAVRIIPGGAAVALGSGGADLPSTGL